MTSKFINHAHADPPSEDDVLSTLRRNDFAPFVELRSKDGRRLRLGPSSEKSLTLQRLERFERRLSRHQFKICGRTIPPVLFSLTRIYSQDYSRGGRYYSAFQTRSSQFRLQIEINGVPVAEADYKALHPNLLYQLVGLEAPQDPYDLGDGFPRSAVKKAFQVLINRSQGSSAVNSLVYWLNEHRRKGKPDPADWKGGLIKVDKDWCHRLEKRLREHLKPIESYFCKGVGLQLQHYDSQLVSHVIDYFLVKTDSVVIPIHDSFLVKQTDLPILMEALRYAEIALAKEINRPLRVPTFKVETSRPQEGYDKLVRALGLHQAISEVLEDARDDVLGLEDEVFKEAINNQYLLDFQIEADSEG